MLRLLIILLLSTNICTAQSRIENFWTIDRKARDIEASTVDSLAKLLTASYHTELEKTRAIFSWIAEDEYLLTLAILSSNPVGDKFDRG